MSPPRRRVVPIGAASCVALVAVSVLAVLPPPAHATPTAIADGVVDDPLTAAQRSWLEEHAPLRVGWPAFPPMAAEGEDGEDGEARGYGVDTWDLAALQLGIELEHVVLGSLTETVAAYDDDRVDVIGGAGERPDLAGEHRTTSYAWPPVGVVTTPDRLGRLSPTLADARVTSVPGSPLFAELPERFPDAQVVSVQGTVAGLHAVVAGDVDAFYGPYALIGDLAIREDLDLVPFGEPDEAGVGISAVAPPGSPQAAIMDAMRGTLGDGQLSLIHVRWTGFDLGDPAATEPLPTWVLATGIGVLLLLLALLLFVALLRVRVRAATADLRAANAELEARVDERTADLVRSNDALRRFSSTAAHDLKGPLVAIRGLTSVLRSVDLEPRQRDDMLGRIGVSAKRLGSMIDAMLEDAIAIGQGTEAVDGPAFATWLEEVCAPEVQWVDGRLRVHVPDRPIDADVEVLRRAAMNLVGNAAKYAVNDGGPTIEVHLRRDDSRWLLVVDDDGPGIADDDRRLVFDRGARLVADDRGFGLGLSAIRDLVVGAGGVVTVDRSTTLGGARFTVELPTLPAHRSGSGQVVVTGRPGHAADDGADRRASLVGDQAE